MEAQPRQRGSTVASASERGASFRLSAACPLAEKLAQCNSRRMERTPDHPVPRMDETVTRANLHERAEAVAIPDFNYLEQIVAGVTDALTSLGHHRSKGGITRTGG